MTDILFLKKRQIGHNTWEFIFQPKQPIQYASGQYIDVFTLRLLDDPRGQSRTFSLTSTPVDDFISFATFTPENPSPFKELLLALQPGEALQASEAMGDMVLPRLQSTSLVFVAGGLGIASFISHLKTCERSNLSHPVTLLWALRKLSDAADFPVLDTFDFAYRHDYVAPERVLTSEILARAGATGMIYVSGSQKFTESIVAELRALGHPDTRLAFDYFTGYQDIL